MSMDLNTLHTGSSWSTFFDSPVHLASWRVSLHGDRLHEFAFLTVDSWLGCLLFFELDRTNQEAVRRQRVD